MAEPDKRLEELAVMREARESVEGSVRSIVGQFVEALNDFINHVGTQLMNRFRACLEGAYIGSHLLCYYTLTHISGVGATKYRFLLLTLGGKRFCLC